MAGRSLTTEDVCFYCGLGGNTNFVLNNDGIKKRHLTSGKECFPICVQCLDEGKKVEKKKGKKDEQQARKEKAYWEKIAKSKKNNKSK